MAKLSRGIGHPEDPNPNRVRKRVRKSVSNQNRVWGEKTICPQRGVRRPKKFAGKIRKGRGVHVKGGLECSKGYDLKRERYF